MATYKCPICQSSIRGDVLKFTRHTDKHIVEVLKKKHPNWVSQDGLCPKCYEYYRGEIEGTTQSDPK